MFSEMTATGWMIGIAFWAFCIWRCANLFNKADKSNVLKKTAMKGAANFLGRMFK